MYVHNGLSLSGHSSYLITFKFISDSQTNSCPSYDHRRVVVFIVTKVEKFESGYKKHRMRRNNVEHLKVARHFVVSSMRALQLIRHWDQSCEDRYMILYVEVAKTVTWHSIFSWPLHDILIFPIRQFSPEQFINRNYWPDFKLINFNF